MRFRLLISMGCPWTCTYRPHAYYLLWDHEVVIGKNVEIGANCTIVCGVTIGEHSFIAAGAVIIRNVKPFAIMAGVPGKQIGWMSEYGHRLEFDSDGFAVCSESGENYELKDGVVAKKG